jgi:signal peptidase I
MSANVSASAQRTSLAVEGLRSAGRLSFRVHGTSMLPTLWPGDMVTIEACAVEDVRAGEVVLACSGDRLFLHRFVGATENGFRLRGDSMPGSDPEFGREAMLGRLLDVARLGRSVRPAAKRNFVSRSLGFCFCHFDLARRIALRWHQRRLQVVSRLGVPEVAAPALSGEGAV